MTATIQLAEAALTAADANYEEALRLYSLQSEGSGAQERRREERLMRLQSDVDRCRLAVEDARRANSGPQ